MRYVKLVTNISLQIFSSSPEMKVKQIQLIYLPCNEYFGLPVSVTFPVNRNVNDEECLPLVSVSKGFTSLL